MVITGRLGSTPILNEVEGVDGKMHKVTDVTIYAQDRTAPKRKMKDGRELPKGVPMQCRAWGERAEMLADMKSGDTVTAIAEMKYGVIDVGGRKIEHNTFLIRKIDRKNNIAKQMEELLTGYEKGEYDRIFDRNAVPDFNKIAEKDKASVAFMKDYPQQKSSEPVTREKEDIKR